MAEITNKYPIPPKSHSRPKRRRYPELYMLRKGESFFIPGVNSRQVTPYIAYAKKAGWREESINKDFTCRTAFDDELGKGIRVWRTK